MCIICDSLLTIIDFRDTGKPKGFSFINFEDQRSTVLSVDNLNGIRLCNRFLKVDHVRDYKPPDFNDKSVSFFRPGESISTSLSLQTKK